MATINAINSNIPIELSKGGTNATSMATTFGVNYFDGTRIVTTAVGTATHVLTSNGVGLAPTFQVLPSSGITTLNGDSGSATGATVTLAGTANQIVTSAAVSTVTFALTPSVIIANDLTLTNGDANIGNTDAAVTAPFVTFKKSRSGAIITSGDDIGELSFQAHDGVSYFTSARIRVDSSGTIGAGRVASAMQFYTAPDSATASTLRGTFNAVGGLLLAAPDTGTNPTLSLSVNASNIALAVGGARFITYGGGTNTFVGQECGTINASSVDNTCVGYQSLSSLSSGTRNTAVGKFALTQLTTGAGNLALGHMTGGFGGAGVNYTSSESNNILLNNTGVVGESNKLRIGSATGTGVGELNAAYIAGIYGGSNSGTQNLAVIDSANKLGSSTTTSVTGSLEMSSYIKADTVFNTVTTTSSAGQYQINGTAVLHTYGTDNLFIGAGAGTFTAGGSKNVCVGPLAGAALGANACINNVYVGYKAGTADAGTGSGNLGGNVGIGKEALAAFTGATESENTALGTQSLDQVVTGERNVAVGWNTGHNLTTNDSDNIFIGWDVEGSAGNNNRLTIGKATGTGQGEINLTKISGISGITTVNNDAVAVLVDSADQLGTVSSSMRYKESVQDMGDLSSVIYQFRPVSFMYKNRKEWPRQIGLIAEEVEQVMPNLVAHNKEGLPESIKYHELPTLLLNEIQKLNKRIEKLEASLVGRIL